MKEKFNLKGFLKNSMYGFMDGATMAFSWAVSAFNIYGTIYCIKNKQYRSSAKWFAWLAAVSTFQAARNTWMTSKYLNGEICNYDWTIIVPDKDEKDTIEEI